MFGDYFYNQTLRKMTIAFGQIFNNIQIKRKDSNGNVVQSIRVPLAYAPKEKFLTRLDQQPNLNDRQFAVTLPRLSFEIQGISYDATRKLSPTQYIRNTKAAGDNVKSYMPIPYNINFELSIMAKNQDDSLQILEQILPFFQPSFTITMNLIPDLGEKRDYPVTLTAIDYEDVYEGDYDTRRTLVYNLSFIAKTFLYGPVQDADSEIIKKAIVDYNTKDKTMPTREVRYQVTPDPLTADPDDNFGFNEIFSEFQDAKSRNPVTGADE